MLDVLNIVLPVFLVVGSGYALVRFGLFPEAAVGALMKFAQSVAVPCLLFMALIRLDLGANFDPALMASFYTGALLCFALGYLAARKGFGRRPGESVALGFAALFSNSVLLGLAVTEQAYGTEALAPNFALIAIHAPFCYLIGITAMEIARADGRSGAETARIAATAMFRNPITMASAAGLLANVTGAPLPEAAADAADMIGRAALPAALFGLGGVLSRYRIRSTLGEALTITALSTLVHPAIAFTLSHHVFALEPGFVRSATIMAAMAPGVNAYMFSSMYQRAEGEVASTVIIATAVSVVTASGWIWVLAHMLG